MIRAVSVRKRTDGNFCDLPAKVTGKGNKMNIFDILLLGVALSMDAVAVSMTNGMTDREMGGKKMFAPALLFGAFQAAMPLVGYFLTDFLSSSEAIKETFEKASKGVAFALLAFIGGKMIFDGIKERRDECKAKETGVAAEKEGKTLSAGEMIVQAFATSVDALAVGISLKMAAMGEGLSPVIGWSVTIIGCITFALSLIAARLGRLIGNELADKAEIFGGAVLVIIGLKILLF